MPKIIENLPQRLLEEARRQVEESGFAAMTIRILKVDKILMKKKYSDAIINGVKAKDFPPLPVDYGYRDSKNFWFHRKTWMRAELLPFVPLYSVEKYKWLVA